MSAGFIYFASTFPGHIKVGRFSSHLTVADKERQYRTLVPGFTIFHVYPADDVVAEEARVLAHLRLVAGTAVTGAGRENFEISKEVALEAAGTDMEALAKQARTAIYRIKPGLDGLTVAELISEINRNHADEVPARIAVPRNFDIGKVLRSVGVHVNSALPEMDLDVAVFGVVIEPKKLLKACPALKPCATVLEGLYL
ncbi:hypothetical protein G3A43_06200 [Paraburkholderia aspalathi]|nr:hypothetical protein [Paraburkholderia aspalathi]MBK3779839.1 hypothetical protein [Paraburkholderia aspalathi]